MGQTTYQIRNLTIGSGIPKICVPVCGHTVSQVLEETEKVSQSEADLMEWRLDYLNPMPETKDWKEILRQIRERLGDKPLLVTYRTKQEGGAAGRQISCEEYAGIYRSVLKVGEADLLDIEYNLGAGTFRPLLEAARQAGALSVLSYHNFQKTPDGKYLLGLYREMEELGGDILKIAVTPETREDLLSMLQVSLQAFQEREKPIISISMGELGVESRICCEAVGSAVTFASLTQASAPGQLPVDQLRTVLEIIHGSRRRPC